jgi:hypothetical protein
MDMSAVRIAAPRSLVAGLTALKDKGHPGVQQSPPMPAVARV